jgi:hypothetical protein
MRISALAMALTLAATAVRAADEEGSFAIKGAGVETCAAYLAARDRNPAAHAMFLGWLEGYLTAVNELSPGVFDVAFWRERGLLGALLEVNCRGEPDQRYGVVVRAMVKELKRSPLEEKSDLIEARIGERGVPLYRATLLKVEETLAARGIDPGEVDGRWDDAARRGLLEFQRSQDELTPTGLPDQATLAKLLGVQP